MNKLIAIVVALTMVMALSLGVYAFEGSQEVVLVVQEQGSWATTTSEPVTINAPGEYTFTISGLSFDGANLTVLYVKDKAAYDAGDDFTGTSNLSGFTCLTKSIKINGEAVELTEGYRTGLTDAGVFDICWHNIWDTNYMPTPTGTVTDIEVVIEIVDAEGGASAPAEDPAAGDGTAEDNNTVEPDTTTSSNEDTTPAPAPSTSTAPATGLTLAVVPAIMALAAVAVSKKR